MISNDRRSQHLRCTTSKQGPDARVTSQSTTKARQAHKIRELGDALVAAGYNSLDQQAKTLGLPRSTTWTMIRAGHKSSGLSAAVINRILSTPQLPSEVRARILEYVEEKVAGLYGHGKSQITRFSALIKKSNRC